MAKQWGLEWTDNINCEENCVFGSVPYKDPSRVSTRPVKSFKTCLSLKRLLAKR